MKSIKTYITIILISLVLITTDHGEVTAQFNNQQTTPQKVNYYALLISVEQYTQGWPDLTARTKQLDKLSAQLRRHNYHITRTVNPTGMGLRKTIYSFIEEYSRDNNVLLVFYTGHSYINQQGNSCLIPSDCPLPSAKNGLVSKIPLPVAELLDYFDKQKVARLLLAIDGSVSLYRAGLKLLQNIAHASLPPSVSTSSYAVLGAGSAAEAELNYSPFIDIFIQAMSKASTGQHRLLRLKPFCEFIENVGMVNSWQFPWCKVKDNQAVFSQTVLFDQNNLQKINARKPSFFRITTVPDSATIRILNIVPKYPINGIELYPKDYKIEASAQGYDTLIKTVSLPPGEEFEYSIYLSGSSPSTSTLEPVGLPSEPTKKNTQTAVAKDLLIEDKAIVTDAQLGFKLIKIDKGTFTMGGSRYNEGPVHTEKIVTDFYIMDSEVSIKQYLPYLKATQKKDFSISIGNNTDLPVVNINWHDAVDYAQWVSSVSGRTYRLPTEAEWEYVAQMGLSLSSSPPFDTEKTERSPVYSAWRNSLNIYGMPGNVWEWCLDNYSERYAQKKNHTDTSGNKALRGGSWKDSRKSISATSRLGLISTTKANNIGFRLVTHL